jgi:hypothetical protein
MSIAAWTPNKKVSQIGSGDYDEIEKSLACIKNPDMNKAPQSGWF